jgi:hypothetical protein
MTLAVPVAELGSRDRFVPGICAPNGLISANRIWWLGLIDAEK